MTDDDIVRELLDRYTGDCEGYAIWHRAAVADLLRRAIAAGREQGWNDALDCAANKIREDHLVYFYGEDGAATVLDLKTNGTGTAPNPAVGYWRDIERAAIVAWLREARLLTLDGPVSVLAIDDCANKIERGEHLEKKDE